MKEKYWYTMTENAHISFYIAVLLHYETSGIKDII